MVENITGIQNYTKKRYIKEFKGITRQSQGTETTRQKVVNSSKIRYIVAYHAVFLHNVFLPHPFQTTIALKTQGEYSGSYAKIYSSLCVLETSTDAIHWVCVPHLWVPSLEPASEGWGLKALLYSDDWGATTTRGVRVHIFFSWWQRNILWHLTIRYYIQCQC